MTDVQSCSNSNQGEGRALGKSQLELWINNHNHSTSSFSLAAPPSCTAACLSTCSTTWQRLNSKSSICTKKITHPKECGVFHFRGSTSNLSPLNLSPLRLFAGDAWGATYDCRNNGGRKKQSIATIWQLCLKEDRAISVCELYLTNSCSKAFFFFCRIWTHRRSAKNVIIRTAQCKVLVQISTSRRECFPPLV